MRTKTVSFNPIGLLFLFGVLLLIAGVIPFTAPWVGGLILLGEVEFKLTWTT